MAAWLITGVVLPVDGGWTAAAPSCHSRTAASPKLGLQSIMWLIAYFGTPVYYSASADCLGLLDESGPPRLTRLHEDAQ